MMTIADNDIGRLAQSYYRGEMGYEFYRNARTELLDKLTLTIGNEESAKKEIEEKPGQLKKHEVVQPWRWYGLIGLLALTVLAMLITWSVGVYE